jgi:hypothetical protein
MLLCDIAYAGIKTTAAKLNNPPHLGEGATARANREAVRKYPGTKPVAWAAAGRRGRACGKSETKAKIFTKGAGGQ